MKHVKSVLALILTLLFISQAAIMAAAAAEIQHPEVWAYGDVQKIVYPGRSIFEYKDDQGLSSTLPFERQDKNITIAFSNIVFSKNFENKSISTATESGSTSQFTITKDTLTTSEGIEYIYLKMTNKTALSADTHYYVDETLDVSEEPAVTNNYYLLVTGKVQKTGDNLALWKVSIAFYFVDAGASERTLTIEIHGETGTDGYSSGTSGVTYKCYGKDNTWMTVLLKIQDMLDVTSKSWSLSKLTKVKYNIGLTTGSSLDASSVVEAEIRHAVVVPSKVYIDDPAYTDGLIVNGTSGEFTPQAGDVIQVYGANTTKIVGVTIPWQVEMTPEIDKDPDNLRMQYTWEFTMPKSPSEIGDTLTFSNTNMTLKSWKDGSAWDKLYLNGVDKLTNIANLKVDETLGYWTYALASSLSEGNMYQAIGRVQYTADEYDSLTAAPLFWENPVAWIMYKFWSLVIAVAAFLGLSATWAVKQRRKAQIPKVK